MELPRRIWNYEGGMLIELFPGVGEEPQFRLDADVVRPGWLMIAALEEAANQIRSHLQGPPPARKPAPTTTHP